MTNDARWASTSETLTVVDSLDAGGFARRFHPAGQLIFGNADPVVGPEAIEENCAQFYQSLRGMSHRIVNEWNVGADTIVELSVTYTRLDGATVTIPATTIWTVDPDGRIQSYRVMVDLAPVFT
jgi:hypothetical protein